MLQGEVKDADGYVASGEVKLLMIGSEYDWNDPTYWDKLTIPVTSGLFVYADYEFDYSARWEAVYTTSDAAAAAGLYSIGKSFTVRPVWEFADDMPSTFEQGQAFVFKMKGYSTEHPYYYPTGSNGAITIKFYDVDGMVIGTQNIEPQTVYDSSVGGNVGYYAGVVTIPAGAVSMVVYEPTAGTDQANGTYDYVYYGLPIKSFDVSPRSATYEADRTTVPGYAGETDTSIMTDQPVNITVKSGDNNVSGTLHFTINYYNDGSLLASVPGSVTLTDGVATVVLTKDYLQYLGEGSDYAVLSVYAEDGSGYYYQASTLTIYIKIIKGVEISGSLPSTVGYSNASIVVRKKDGLATGTITVWYAVLDGPEGTWIGSSSAKRVPSDLTEQSDIEKWLVENGVSTSTTGTVVLSINPQVFIPVFGTVKVAVYAKVVDGNEESYAYTVIEKEIKGYNVDGAVTVTYGDPVTLKLRVTDQSGNPVNNARVVIYRKDGGKIVPDVFAKKSSSYADQTQLEINGAVVNIINGTYDFNAVYGDNVDFTAGKAITLYAKVYAADSSVMAIDVPVVIIEPKEDLSVSVTGTIIPGEPSDVTISVSGLPTGAKWNLEISDGTTASNISDSSYTVNLTLAVGTYTVSVETIDGNHKGSATFEVKPVDIAVSKEGTLTYGMEYKLTGTLTFGDAAYAGANYEIYFVKGSAATLVATNALSGSTFDITLDIANANYEKALIKFYKNDKYVGSLSYNLGAPKVTIKDKDGNEVEASADVIIGYVGQNVPVDLTVTEADGTPLAGISVNLTIGGGTVATGVTDENGKFTAIIKANAVSLLGIEFSGGSIINADIFKRTVSIAMDTEAPTIEITEPADISAPIDTMSKDFRIAGTVKDNVGVDKVIVIVNGVPVNTIVPVAGFFATNVELEPGTNTIVLRAYDVNGNEAESPVITVNYTEPKDETAPEIQITSPVVPEGMLVYETDQAEITVKGTVSDEGTGVAAVYVNGEKVDLIGDTFAKKVKLTEGTNEIVVTAVDYAGNSAQAKVTVVYDPYLNKLVIELSPGSQFYKVNGETKVMDVAPFINEAGRTMVPVRFIAEAMGLAVQWNAEKRQVVISGEETEVILTIDSNIAMLDGTPVRMDSKAVIVNGRTFVPLRFVAEAFGFEVQWNAPVITLIKEK